MPEDSEPPADPEKPAEDEGEVEGAVADEVRVQARAQEEEAAALRLPVRLWFWPVALLLVLVVVLVEPFYEAYSDGNGGPGGPMFGSSYLPILPYLLLGLAILVWNPLCRWSGVLRSLALRGRELILLLVVLFGVAGLVSFSHVGGFFMLEKLEKPRNKDEHYQRLFKEYPRELSLPSLWEAEGGDEDDALEPDEATRLILERLKSRNEPRPLAELLTPPKDYPPHQDYRAEWMALSPWGKAFDAVKQTDDILKTAAGPALGTTPASPLGRAMPPAYWSSAIFIATILVVLGLIAVTARQWTHHERLQHPLVQVPAGLVRPGVLRSRGFLIAVGAILAINIYNYLQSIGKNPLPPIKIGIEQDPLVQMEDAYKIFGVQVSAGSRWLYSNFWGAIRVIPFAIGLAFLLALDLGFSLWGMFFFGAILAGWLYAGGIPVSFAKHGRLAQGGAALGMALIVLWMGRLHYWRLLRAAFWAGRDPGDRTGVWGLRVLLLGAALFVWLLWWQMGCHLGGVLLGLLIFGAFFLVIARLIAETGLAYFQFQIIRVIYALGLPFLVPIEAVVIMCWLGTNLATDTRKNLAGFAVQASAAGERAGLEKRKVFPLLFGVMAATVVVGVVATLIANWVCPGSTGSNPNPPGGLRLSQLTGMYQHAASHPGHGFFELVGHESYQAAFGAVVTGFVLIFALYLLRRIWVRSPFNPLGLVVFACFPLMQVWASLLIGWFAKFLVLRYGGSQLYVRLKPIAIGLIFGDVFGQGVLMVLKAIRAYTVAG